MRVRVLLGLGVVGDRSEELIEKLGEIAARDADVVAIGHKERYFRGRTAEELEGLMRAGAELIKIEGEAWMADGIRELSRRGVPVCAHLGLTPQSVHQLGGFKVQGKTDAAAEQLKADGLALQVAGASMVVLEAIPASLGKEVTELLAIPTIGIGASAQCDGQVLVTEDMLGMFDRVPRFVKKYEDIAGVIERTVVKYAEEVRARSFPTSDQTYQPKG